MCVCVCVCKCARVYVYMKEVIPVDQSMRNKQSTQTLVVIQHESKKWTEVILLVKLVT